jgi:type IV secretion system protein VirB9
MRWLCLLLLLVGQSAYGQVRPVPGAGDPRLQSILYDPDQVVQLSVASGYQLMVSLAPGERIETVAVGDSAAWQVTPSKRGDSLFVKNIQASSVTNMSIITDARVYNFELLPASGYSGDAAYLVRFTYPASSAAQAPLAEAGLFTYRIRGARMIKPSTIDQIGNMTAIEWPADSPMPAVFGVENGQETLINGEMREGRYMVAGTPQKLIFRLGKQIAYAIRLSERAKRK